MGRTDRAKQFAPFDALDGFGAAIKAQEHIVIPRKVLSEDRQEELDRICSNIDVGDQVTVTYYSKDCYQEVCGQVDKIFPLRRLFIIEGTMIKFADIYDLVRI